MQLPHHGSLVLGGALLLGLLPLGALGFQNPVAKPGPDPCLIFVDGSYYLTRTTSVNITITRAKKLGDLLNGETKTVWEDTNTTRGANMWAPEMWQIDNLWYMLYSSCSTLAPCCDSCQTRVLRGCDAPNPYDCAYEFLADLVPPEGKRGGPAKDDTFSIDGSFLEVPGWGRYHILSARDEDKRQSIQITMLDTDKWTVSGWNIISRADQDWEMNNTNIGSPPPAEVDRLNEGPHPLYRNGEIWVMYSASFCGSPNYSLGLLHYKGGDPLQESSWEKMGPVLSPANGNFGTGHNSVFQSPDGKEMWNAFHATANSNGSCGDDRYTMAQIITFDDDNNPNFGTPQPLSAIIQDPSGE